MLRPIRLLTALLAFLLLPAAALAQRTPDGDEKIPLDPKVRTGTLDNGLRYYIRPNDEPKDRAQLRLVVDAGSVLEAQNQRGVAHFVEHMLFNGTRHFEKHEIIDFLEGAGMKFGPDLNAYTSFNETVYKLTIPTDSTQLMQTAFDVLKDWAAYATLSAEQIEKERGVILEEHRARYETAGGRMQKQILPVIFHDSRYAERLPIGKPKIIKNVSPETIRSFYETWYRPGLMAVVAVGDFDPDRIERLIKEHFAGLENPDDPRERKTYDVPGHAETLYEVASDPEYPRTSVQVLYKSDHEDADTVGDLRESLAEALFSRMLNDRLDQVARRENAPFLGAGTGRGNYVRPLDVISLSASTKEGQVLEGLEGVLTEAERVREHGFTETELARAKKELLSSLKSAYEDRENTSSRHFAGQLVSYFLTDDPAPGIAYRYHLAQELLPTIGLDDVNALAGDLFGKKNRVVIVRMPEKEGLKEPTKSELAAVVNSIQEKDLEPWVDEVNTEPLISDMPALAEVTARSTIEEIGITEITLENGVRVVMKPTDFKEDQVLFRAFSPGGSSLVSDEDYFEASRITSIMSESGLANFTPAELEKKLAGKIVSVHPYISGLEEGFAGSASPEDLETLFQLIHLYATQPRVDSTGLRNFTQERVARLKNRSRVPIVALIDTMRAVLSQGDPRSKPPTVERVKNIDMARGAAIYRTRFADLGDFTFVFVGAFEPQRLERLARTYLGTLPSTPRTESWRDVQPGFPEGVTEKAVYGGRGERSFTAIVFGGPFEYNRTNRHRLQSMAQVLNIRLREKLREQMSGVYSVRVNAGASGRPDEQYNVVIIFSSAPDRAEELSQAVFSVIDEMQSAPASEENMTKITAQQRRRRETNLEENSFWVSRLDYYYSHEGEPTDILRYDALVESLTAEDIQEAARRYLRDERFVKIVLYPKQGADAESTTSSKR